ncbi:hypothetical protein [Thiolapillus sp.]|uniref:hypothetical protein n=1 Tax=Thiolapillus sp. TaxID=2017437 RepID=UPI003AF7E4B1
MDESTPVNPKADRALRRLDAEQQLQAWVRHQDTELVRLRVAGIYGPDKLPLQRLRQASPWWRNGTRPGPTASMWMIWYRYCRRPWCGAETGKSTM